MSVYARLEELGLELPPAPKPVAAYVPWVRSGNLVFISGQLPMLGGKLVCAGAVPTEVAPDKAKAAARMCALNLLAVLQDAAGGDLNNVARVVRLGVFVQSAPGWGEQPGVANGASELMVDLFGDAGRHARAAVGSIGLPLGAPVEVEGTFELKA